MIQRTARVLSILAWCLAGRLQAAAATQEEKLALDQCPATVQAALTQAAGSGTVKRVRRVTQGERVAYVAQIEVAVDRDGQPVPPPVVVDPAVAEAAAAAAAAAALARPVTLQVTATRLQDVCVALGEATGLPVTCGNAIASRLVTVSCQDKPFSEVMAAVAEQTGSRAEPHEGGYRFRNAPK